MLWFSLFILLTVQSYGQQPGFMREQATPFYQRYRLLAIADAARLKPDAPFTSLAFSLPATELYGSAFAIVGSDTLPLRPAAHQPENAEGVVSELLVFDQPRQDVTLLGLAEKTEVTLHFMFAPPLSRETAGKFRKQDEKSCEEPVAVQQAVWRAGLPEPDYTRSFNEVEHLIVHHSATSNSAGNYTQVVRNIYLYHTQTNGWSDIGYNYLIAPDGTLYAGRDPGPAGLQDKVRGAHFCGNNSETMGVCLLGNFMETAPSPAALKKLESLLSWEVYKEKLDPLGIYSHPANPSLPVIASHRNGCATACPGDYLYALLPEVRAQVQARLLACANPENELPFVYTDPQAGEICIGNVSEREVENMQLFTLQGKELVPKAERLQGSGLCWKVEGLAPGIYIVLLEGREQQIRRRILLL